MHEYLAGCEKLDCWPQYGWNVPSGVDAGITSGCSNRLSSKAAASEEARRTLRYGETLSDARTPLGDFFSILLEERVLFSAAVDH